MLTRMVSISGPRDPPALASQSAGITGVNHRARPLCLHLFLILSFLYSFYSSVVPAFIFLVVDFKVLVSIFNLTQYFLNNTRCLAFLKFWSSFSLTLLLSRLYFFLFLIPLFSSSKVSHYSSLQIMFVYIYSYLFLFLCSFLSLFWILSDFYFLEIHVYWMSVKGQLTENVFISPSFLKDSLELYFDIIFPLYFENIALLCFLF